MMQGCKCKTKCKNTIEKPRPKIDEKKQMKMLNEDPMYQIFGKQILSTYLNHNKSNL